jgi:hypothetical protein
MGYLAIMGSWIMLRTRDEKLKERPMATCVLEIDPSKGPRHFLFTCLAAMRGLQATEELVMADYMEWFEKYGKPTKQSVMAWVEGNFELEFAFNVIASRE